jgi:hypothetical protein
MHRPMVITQNTNNLIGTQFKFFFLQKKTYPLVMKKNQ